MTTPSQAGLYLGLCEAVGANPKHVLPRLLPADIADRLAAAEITGEDLRAAAGDDTYTDGYRISRVADCPALGNLRALVRRARQDHGQLQREIDELTRKRDALARLLNLK